jgi:hypothetical protein
MPLRQPRCFDLSPQDGDDYGCCERGNEHREGEQAEHGSTPLGGPGSSDPLTPCVSRERHAVIAVTSLLDFLYPTARTSLQQGGWWEGRDRIKKVANGD